MKYLLYVATCLITLLSCSPAAESRLTARVNPLMGTASTFEFSHGNTYPAVAVPWGMNSWSPQTGENGSGWMYMYTDSVIRGFRQTHQPSPWINDYGTFSLMPVLGTLTCSHRERGATFSHDREKALPEGYEVTFHNGVHTAMSATSRGAVFEITYPAGQAQYVVVDAYQHGGSIEVDPEKGCLYGISRYHNGGVPSQFANYFYVEFDHPVVEAGTDDQACAYVQFDLQPGEVLTLRVASSFISHEQARLNFTREVQGASLQDIREKARAEWEDKLGRIVVEGGTQAQQQTFYSCLYRTLLFPREFFEYDANGQPHYYSPYDGQIHAGYMYTDNGFWDTFRAVHPLFTLLYPEVSTRVMQALLQAYEESGFMPEWASPGHRGCMIGNHSIALLTDAWVKGIQPVDPDKALQAMLHQAHARHPHIASVGRDGFEAYDSLGYVPYPEVPEATAKTLEYAYNDWCIARFAEQIGRKDLAETYYQRAQNYRHLYYPEKGFMWAKDAHGRWRDRFDATEWGGPFTEGCSWHWTWSVMHDPEGLSRLMGGHRALCQRLDSLFTAPNTFNYGTYGFVIHEIAEMVALNMGQYAHGNQPVQHAIYLYNYAGEPWKTQYRIRQVMDKLYQPTPDGYCGDEDNGQTSAWYVFSALGFYPVCPGSAEYVVGSPLFPKATLKMPGGQPFVITADNQGPGRCYIKQATLNGAPFTRHFLRHEELQKGGEWRMEMDSLPHPQRGNSPEDRPYSYTKAARP